LDLKGGIFGQSIDTLAAADARRVMALLEPRGLQVYCLSTSLLHLPPNADAAAFAKDLDTLQHVIEIAGTLRPRVIRLLSARVNAPAAVTAAPDTAPDAALIRVYQTAIDRITAAGFTVMIENEVGANVLSSPAAALAFFAALQRPQVRLIWDIVNMWQSGTFPSLATYKKLRPLIGAIHVKGGQAEHPGGPLAFASSLEDASWPVVEMLNRIWHDQPSMPVCVNWPHGSQRPGYQYDRLMERDLAFVRRCLNEVPK
jgi:sugar phosphate isomerase/epimerase